MENESKLTLKNENLKKNILISKSLSNFKKDKNKSKKKRKIISKGEKNNKKIDNIQKSDDNKNIPKIIKIRNPGVDLVRLLCMYNTVIHHLLVQGKGLKKYSQYKKYLDILIIIINWHNNGFALISGIIGYKSNKYSNLLYLWLYVLFYAVGIHIYFEKFRKNSYIDVTKSTEYFPIIFNRYWYFTQYFGMYLFLPVVNKGISILTKSELKLVVISTIGIFSFWRHLKNPKNDVFHLCGGGSILWFLTLFITGSYIGKYRIEYTGIRKYIYCIFCLFIFSFTSFLYYKTSNNELYLGNGYYQRKIVILLNNIINNNFDSLKKIMQTISITLFFLQLKYNQYLSKIITFFGPIAFGIYLIHINSIVSANILSKIFNNDSSNLTLYSTIALILFKALKITFICLFIDYLRHILFTLLRIRKICIILEKIAFILFG